MFRKNGSHRQKSMFGSLNELPPKQQQRPAQSWAGTFYDEIFTRIDETPYAVLYDDRPSRPNIPVNILVGLEILKAGFGWSDEEMYENSCDNLQVRHALGLQKLTEGYFELRTQPSAGRFDPNSRQHPRNEPLATAGRNPAAPPSNVD